MNDDATQTPMPREAKTPGEKATATKLDHERVARVLVDAIVTGDEAAAKKWGLSVRTVQRYRVHSAETPMVAELVAELRAEVMATWVDDVKSAAAAALARIRVLVDGSDDLHDVVGAFKILNDARVTDEVLSAAKQGASIPLEPNGKFSRFSGGRPAAGRQGSPIERAAERLDPH